MSPTCAKRFARARGFTGIVYYRFLESSDVDGKFRGYPTDVYRNQGQSRKRERQRTIRVNQWPIDAIVCEDGQSHGTLAGHKRSSGPRVQAPRFIIGPGSQLSGSSCEN